MEFVNPVVSCVANAVAIPIMKHVKYAFTADGNTKALESVTADLRARKNDVKKKIRDAEQENGVATEQAQHWVTQVENIEKEAEELQQKYRQLCRCLCNICPNVWSVYKISKIAANKLAETRSLQQREPTPDRITRVQRPLHHVMPTPSSKSPYLESALRYVKGAEHNIIGILGMGGVGKTHLVMQIHEQLKPPEFDAEVIYIPCSMQCSDEEIQNKIIENRGISKNGSMEQNKRTICKFLSETSFVLILDNLWSCVNLHNIGIPNPENTPGKHKQKVVLTTRSRRVCGEMRVEKTIEVDPLKMDDAWPLFEKMAEKETINSHPLIQKYAVDIVEKLGGLPLAIIAVGKAMYSNKDPSEWEHALERLKKAGLKDVESQCKDQFVFHTLKISYDNLRDETLKNCFLHCSLWPHGFEIPKDELVELWMGLGLIDEPDLQTAYNVGFSYIGELKRVFLLQGDDDEKFIKMHDVMHDMALWIKKDKWIVQVGTNTGSVKIGISNGTEGLSAMKTGATDFSFSSQDSSTKTITLLLNRNHLNTSITLPLQLFSLLTVLDLSHNKLNALPVAICTLVHLQFLNLSHNRFNFGLLPTELGDLTELKYLLLRGLSCVFPKGVLLKLKALRVLDCSHSPFMDGNHEKLFSTLGEVQCLPSFQALGIGFWSMHDDDISEFCNNPTSAPYWIQYPHPRPAKAQLCIKAITVLFYRPIKVKKTLSVNLPHDTLTNQSLINHKCTFDCLQELQIKPIRKQAA
ncbi:hypothetical protein LUZ61_010983 [Rhynchospora tenuis]|uniref:AAA+ ATPase domain-containing protein n=1 Tax=Rhynchospora tenuis TaxID=198213 RepID=A0AAD6F062_9POAL|nr:hypothetical protein LUZ61_010983 [Rhynchospora tenuis]